MFKVAVILLNWNGIRDTLVCLDSLRKLKKDNLDVFVVVVDNASTDNSARQIQQKYPEIEVIDNPENLGFTGGNNLGIEYALKRKANYIWLLNNDTTVDPDALIELYGSFRSDKVGIVGPKIYFTRGCEFHKNRYKSSDLGKVIWYAGGIIDWQNMYGTHRGVDELDIGQYDEEEETDFISGCSMLIKSEVLRSIGFLDDKYFVYYEDLDFCLHASRAGYKLVYQPRAKVWHRNAGSAGGSGSKLQEYYQTRNRLLFGFRYAPIRTRLALAREAIRVLWGDRGVRRQAVNDFIVGKLGKNNE